MQRWRWGIRSRGTMARRVILEKLTWRRAARERGNLISHYGRGGGGGRGSEWHTDGTEEPRDKRSGGLKGRGHVSRLLLSQRRMERKHFVWKREWDSCFSRPAGAPDGIPSTQRKPQRGGGGGVGWLKTKTTTTLGIILKIHHLGFRHVCSYKSETETELRRVCPFVKIKKTKERKDEERQDEKD